ncbi:unnamed protein product [Ilex paraguariensis]|uniref:Uncharacterized protein n=1 Tax=Ilex paraguariensis TaxID=185542 RepID=A0ABC8SQ79_9AQUA
METLRSSLKDAEDKAYNEGLRRRRVLWRSKSQNLPPTEVPVANTPVVVSFTVLIDDSTVDPIDPSDVL